MNYLVSELITILSSKKYNLIEDKKITGIAIDSRKVKEGDLFIPFIGENTDGHNYIEVAFENGAAATLSMKEHLPSNYNTIYVEDSYNAIQILAKHYLNDINPITIAITGSNGKTTTKDIISSCLSSKYIVNKTQGNFNNELGVPITILNTQKDTEVLVLEMGADGFGQLDFLSKLVNPNFTVITNIGESHIEFFKSREGIARAKFEITNHMKNDGYFIYNGDEPLLTSLVEKTNINSISCGFNKCNDIILENYELNKDEIHFNINKSNLNFVTTLKGKHNLLNIMFAIAICRKLNMNYTDILESIKSIDSITNMRLQSITYKDNSLIINDAYNASPTSMKAAIDVTDELRDFNYKTIVLGDMFELGTNELEYHKEIGLYINNTTKTINRLITVGTLSKNIYNTANIKEKYAFSSNEEVISFLKNNKKDNEVILFKASRSMKLEKIIEEIIK